MTQRPNAIDLAEKALAVCGSLTPVPTPTEARLLGIVATAHVANFEWDKAVEFYEQAIEAAGSYFDLRGLAKMYSGLSSAYHELAQTDGAAGYRTRAVTPLEGLG